jgi:uncharacterized protein (DUF169 family)
MTAQLRNSLDELLGRIPEPVAVTFRDDEPLEMERVSKAAPAGCAYWKLGGEGRVFYTTADDHLNCPIGAFTHGIELSGAGARALNDMVGTMVTLHYIRPDEVAAIPRKPTPTRYVVYAPLSKADGIPDVVLLHGTPQQVMLLVEAANARQLLATVPTMGRPACAVIAATMASGKAATSLGCVGNRVYTGLSANELYIGIPGAVLPDTLDALRSIVNANKELEAFHQARCESVSSPNQ